MLLGLMLSLSNTQAQNIPVPFVSLSTGTFIIAHEDFEKVYDSNIGFAFGGNIGFPITTNAFIFGKVTRFQKEGVPVFIRFDIIDGEPANIEEYRDGDASFSEWMLSPDSDIKISKRAQGADFHQKSSWVYNISLSPIFIGSVSSILLAMIHK